MNLLRPATLAFALFSLNAAAELPPVDLPRFMARTPSIPGADYAALLGKVEKLCYDARRMQKVPQRWN